MLPVLRLLLAMLLAAALPLTAMAKPAKTTENTAPAKIMLLGVFHFDNPGLDAVKFTPIDVTTPASQKYLTTLAERIARFKPTRILLEYPSERDAVFNQRYQNYLANTFELERNEIYQIGFRVAKQSGLTGVSGFDEEAPGEDSLWGYLEQVPKAQQRLMALIEVESKRLQHAHATKTLRALLRADNSPADDRHNKGFYLTLNDVGAKEKLFHGADMAARWWQRNFRMYANVQQAAQPGERVLVIAGSGHTAILRDLLHADADRVEEPVLDYL
ncbi:MAG: hypothetical protein JNN30_18730 [Rhodanobacteraceae bacterium]|nr:hypothetical protein [Rhodanobacteraceae bacterium]